MAMKIQNSLAVLPTLTILILPTPVATLATILPALIAALAEITLASQSLLICAHIHREAHHGHPPSHSARSPILIINPKSLKFGLEFDLSQILVSHLYVNFI